MMFMQKGLFDWSQLFPRNRLMHIHQQHLMQEMAFQNGLGEKKDKDLGEKKDKDLDEKKDKDLGEKKDKDLDEKKDINFGIEWDHEKMLNLYIYDYMKKKGRHDAAAIFAEEANIQMFELTDSGEGLLKEWWEVFWPNYCSRVENKAGGNSQSSPQPFNENALALLALMTNQGATSPQTPVENQQEDAISSPVNMVVMGQSLSSVMESPGQRRAGKRPMNNDDTDSNSGKSASLQVPPPIGNPSPDLLVTNQWAQEVTEDPKKNDTAVERSEQVEPNCHRRNPSAFKAKIRGRAKCC